MSSIPQPLLILIWVVVIIIIIAFAIWLIDRFLLFSLPLVIQPGQSDQILLFNSYDLIMKS